MKKIPYLDFIASLLPQEDFSKFKASYQTQLPKSIKIITSKIKKSDFLHTSTIQWRSLTPPQLSSSQKTYDDLLYLHQQDKTSLGNHFLHQWGFCYIQEISAGLAAQILNPQKGDLILDLCAAPWGKSVQIADQLTKFWDGFLLANEPLSPRRKALIFNINRCGLQNTAISGYRWEQLGNLVSEIFDKVLVDAPCSGEGMNYKHDKTTHIRDPKIAQNFSKLQLELLVSGLKTLKVWWELIYSTCTLNPLENEGVISSLLKYYPDAVQLLPIDIKEKSPGLTHYNWHPLLTAEQANQLARFRPHIQHTGWFFIAKIKKLKSLPNYLHIDKRKQQESWLRYDSTLQNEVWDFLSKERGIPRQTNLSFLASPSTIYLTTPQFSKLPPQLFIEKFWIPIIKIWFKTERIPQQGLACTLGHLASKNTLSITTSQAQKVAEKSDLIWSYGSEGQFIILKRENHWFALAKQVQNTLKNKMH